MKLNQNILNKKWVPFVSFFSWYLITFVSLVMMVQVLIGEVGNYERWRLYTSVVAFLICLVFALTSTYLFLRKNPRISTALGGAPTVPGVIIGAIVGAVGGGLIGAIVAYASISMDCSPTTCCIVTEVCHAESESECDDEDLNEEER